MAKDVFRNFRWMNSKINFKKNMFQNITPVTKTIIIINVIVFLLSFLLPNLMYHLAAYYPFSQSFKIWQIITHMFAHGGWMHLLFNMFTLLSFGPVLEKVLGDRKFISFYLICGLGSFVIYNIWNYFLVQEAANALLESGINPAAIFANADFFHVHPFSGESKISFASHNFRIVILRIQAV